MHRFHGTKDIFRACDEASVSQDTELSQRDVFSYFPHHKRVQTGHTLCVKVEDLTMGEEIIYSICQSRASLVAASCEI